MAAHDLTPLPPALPALAPGGALARPASAEPVPASPDALALLKALRRRWLMALSLGVLLAGAAGAAAYFVLPARFTAFSLLQVNSRRGSLFERLEGTTDFTTLMNTIAGRIKARQVLMRALSQDQVRHLRLIKKHPDTLSALTWFEENLKVDHTHGSELITVSLSGEDPGDLVVIVNAWVGAYLKIFNDEEKSQNKVRLDKVKVVYEEAKVKLREKVAQKEDLLKRQGASDNQTMQQRQLSLQGKLDQAQNMLTQVQFELEKKLAQLAHLKAQRSAAETKEANEAAVREAVEADLKLRQLEGDMNRANKTIERLRLAGHPENDSTLRKVLALHASHQKAYDEHLQKLKTDLTEKLQQKRVALSEAAVQSLQTEIAPLENHVKKWLDKVEKLTSEVGEIRISNDKYIVLDNEIAQEQKNVNQLFDAYEKAQVADVADSRILPHGEAELQNRDTKKRLFLLGLVPLTALLGTVLAVAWWEFMVRRIHGPDEVASSLALRVVGEVPELPDPRRRLGDGQAEEAYRHHLIESIDAIRTMLLRSAGTENLRVIMVTSAVGGEGKTTLASNLAMSLARAGRKTLLMDCDLRRPAAHQLFEQTLQPGFSEAVLHEVELPDAVRPTTTDPNLHLLPAGHWDREVIQELAKAGITGIFERLRQEYEFIIVDSHPVLPATDSLLLAQQADAVLVSLMRDVSQTHLVHAACRQLAGLGIRVFGAVVNGVPVKVYGKHYQYAQQPAAA